MKTLASKVRELAFDPVAFLSTTESTASARSAVAFSETHSHYLVRFEMPQFLGDEVTVQVSPGPNSELIIRGRKRGGAKKVREVSLRLDTEQPGVFARYHEGVLVVALPKDMKNSLSPVRRRT